MAGRCWIECNLFSPGGAPERRMVRRAAPASSRGAYDWEDEQVVALIVGVVVGDPREHVDKPSGPMPVTLQVWSKTAALAAGIREHRSASGRLEELLRHSEIVGVTWVPSRQFAD